MCDFVTIATYHDFTTASFDKQKLEEQGVDCYLADENTIAVQWTLMNALGGIRLRVPAQAAGEALRILNEKQEEVPVDFKIEEKPNDQLCPNCGSNNTGTEKYSRSIAGWTWLLLGVPVNFTRIKSHRCFYCAHQWEA
ncbi:MAG: hypothetical protein HOP30_17765 [Cyclobacteriaceae bacterium]|nr:hypothetical protein [Cyclobacteriaceae bacterium]